MRCKKLLLSLISLILISALLSTSFASSNKSTKSRSFTKDIHGSTSLSTSMSLNDNPDYSNYLSLGLSYSQAKWGASVGTGLSKAYKVGYEEDEVKLATYPYLKLSRRGLPSFKYLYWNNVYTALYSKDPETRKTTTNYLTTKVGTSFTAPISRRASFTYAPSLSKNFHQYSNGPSGSYTHLGAVNAFVVGYKIVKNLSFSLTYALAHSMTYEGSVKGSNSQDFSLTYIINPNYYVSTSLSSGGSNYKYGKNNLRLYHRNAAQATVVFGGSF